MKTQVIQLFNHDDIISIRDRMEWAKTPRILLIWPRRGKVNVSPLDLTLLRRQAESLGAELGIVTRNRQIRSAARILNISTFSNAPDAQKKQWKGRQSTRPARRFPRENLRVVRQNLPPADLFGFANAPVRRVLIFAIGVMAVLAVVLAFIPSAEVSITLPDQPQVLTIPVSSEPEIQSAQISGIVPQRTLTLIQEGSASALSSGNAILPGKAAIGEVMLMNLTESTIRVPSGTMVMTNIAPQLSYVTTRRVDVPAGKGKTIAAEVVAVIPGKTGNIGPGSVTLIDATLGLQLAVTNPQSIIGGTEEKVALPTDDDRAVLRKRLLLDLQRQALAGFANQISEGDELFPTTLTQVRVLEETYDPQDGKPGEKLVLKMRVEYRIAFADHNDLRFLADQVLNASLPAGFVAVPGPIGYKQVSDSITSQNNVHWQMRSERQIRPILDGELVVNKIQGKSTQAAADILIKTFGLVQKPKIDVHPNWWPWLPFLPVRIAVKG